MTGKRYASIWDAIERTPNEAASLKARAEVLVAIQRAVDGWSMKQTDAAKRLAISQPRLNDLLRGRIDKFSLDALMNLAARAGLSVRVEIAPAAA